ARGVIDADQLNAAVIFNTRFRQAALDQLHAIDLSKSIIHAPFLGPTPRERVVHARDYCWSRVSALGRLHSLPGSLAWAVLGLEKTLPEWRVETALRDRQVHPTEARGILVSVLTVLSLDTTSRHWRPPTPRMHEAMPRVSAWISP